MQAPPATVAGSDPLARHFDRVARRQAGHIARHGRPDYRLSVVLRLLRLRVRRQRKQGGAS